MQKEDLFNNPLISDIRVGGFYCHRFVLLTTCHYFAKIPDVTEVEVNDCERVLKYLYGIEVDLIVEDLVLLDFWLYKDLDKINIIKDRFCYDMIESSFGHPLMIKEYALQVCRNLDRLNTELLYADEILSIGLQKNLLYIDSEIRLHQFIPKRWHKYITVSSIYSKITAIYCVLCTKHLCDTGLAECKGVVVLECSHMFHISCLNCRLQQRSDCRMCGTPIKEVEYLIEE